ncbi:hypothetical protein DESC_770015 [Desulfosarcina cetonica]|nr:hypothetical protein DESC_770015 [Desulfosarcina cetonica]
MAIDGVGDGSVAKRQAAKITARRDGRIHVAIKKWVLVCVNKGAGKMTNAKIQMTIGGMLSI